MLCLVSFLLTVVAKKKKKKVQCWYCTSVAKILGMLFFDDIPHFDWSFLQGFWSFLYLSQRLRNFINLRIYFFIFHTVLYLFNSAASSLTLWAISKSQPNRFFSLLPSLQRTSEKVSSTPLVIGTLPG